MSNGDLAPKLQGANWGHSISNKTYITVITCKEHKRSQAVIMPFNCPDCFRAKSCFTMHKRVHCELHSSPYCDKTF